MAMDMQLDHAEKLLENVRFFIEEVQQKRVNPLDYELLDELNSILVAISWEAIDYLNGLKRGVREVVIQNPIWTADLKKSALMLDALFKNNSTDTLFVLFPCYITIHSGIKALDW